MPSGLGPLFISVEFRLRASTVLLKQESYFIHQCDKVDEVNKSNATCHFLYASELRLMGF